MKYRILITDEGDRVIERECYEFKCMDGWLELFKYAWEAEGIQYVGTGGRTLEEALDEVAKLRHSAEHSGCEPRELV